MLVENWIIELQSTVQEIIQTVENEFLLLGKEQLNRKPSAGQWSMLECFEHLNRYNRFYNAELEKALEQSGKAVVFRPGWLGDYFVRAISPENAKPMKTRKHLDPSGSQLGMKVLEEFLDHQRHLLALLVKAGSVNLNRRAVRVEIFRLLRIKTGDAFRFVIAHERRHLQQALRVKALAGAAAGTIIS